MTPIVIEVHLLDIPEVQAAIAAAVETGIRKASSPVPDGWLTRQEYADLVGLAIGTLYNEPWRFPPFEEGPRKTKCIRSETAREWKSLPVSEQKKRWAKALLASGEPQDAVTKLLSRGEKRRSPRSGLKIAQ